MTSKRVNDRVLFYRLVANVTSGLLEIRYYVDFPPYENNELFIRYTANKNYLEVPFHVFQRKVNEICNAWSVANLLKEINMFGSCRYFKMKGSKRSHWVNSHHEAVYNVMRWGFMWILIVIPQTSLVRKEFIRLRAGSMRRKGGVGGSLAACLLSTYKRRGGGDRGYIFQEISDSVKNETTREYVRSNQVYFIKTREIVTVSLFFTMTPLPLLVPALSTPTHPSSRNLTKKNRFMILVSSKSDHTLVG